MPLPQKQLYTEEDYYNMPEDVRTELIDGQIYYQAAPSRIHQKILSALHIKIGNSSHDYILKLNLYADAGVREYWIVNPMEQTVLVYFFEKDNFKVKQYTFQDKVKVNIYDDLLIDFQKIAL